VHDELLVDPTARVPVSTRTVGRWVRLAATDHLAPSVGNHLRWQRLAPAAQLRDLGVEWRDAVLGGVNYGRDSDSIASMAGAIAGAMGGRSAIPSDLAGDVARASRIDLIEPGERLAQVTMDIRDADRSRRAAVDAQFRELIR
jgi:hypothetical protein